MISLITTKRIKPEFLVYDLEWVPTFRSDGSKNQNPMGLRMCGVFDGDRYRWYTTIDGFISNELTYKNRGKWFYAHAGGLADFQFVIVRLQALGYSVQGSTSGSSAIICHVSRMVWSQDKQCMIPGKDRWHFVDSYWLIRDSLRNIAKWVGAGGKGNENESVDYYADAPLLELRDYNERDCLILFRAIELFGSTLYELGGQLRMTQASCAMDLFRRKFLRADVETNATVNEVARNAYHASRVEVLATDCEDAYYYDVNSSFPYAMTFPVPGALKGGYRGRPKGDPADLWMADVEVMVPDDYLPPLPVRMGGRLFFPTGNFRGWYSNIDIELLLKNGGTIRKMYESMVFEPNTDLRDYSLTLYDLRKRSEGVLKVVCKYLMNSLYGKFAESDLKSEIIVNPPEVRPEWTMMTPGVFVNEKVAPVPHMHVPIAAHVTAIARRTLFECMGYSSELHYCDTDGFSTTQRYRDGNELGEIKLEKYIKRGRFLQAKVYHIDGTDDKGKDVQVVKAKGFSRMNLEKFERLLNFEELTYTRMARIKENARRGDFTPRETLITKGIHRDAISKRNFYPDGQSRPWNHDELRDILRERRVL